ncbi:MAG: glycerophosphodiester phosphodiesterase family protein [Pseudomonadota bacterium]
MKHFFLSASAALLLVACGEADEAKAARNQNDRTTQLEPVALDTSGYATAAEFLRCFEGRAAMVSAHRGGPAPGFPENAIETFENTLSNLTGLLEVDVRETEDGVLILMHDDTVDRTTNGFGDVARMTLDQIKALRLVDEKGDVTDFQVPTLDEALEAMRGRTIMQLDVKRGVGLRQVVRAVENADAESFAALITYTEGGALAVSRESDRVSFVATIDSEAELDRLTEGGLSEDRMIAWTGLIDEPDADLYAFLGERDIPTSGGAIGIIDRKASQGEKDLYWDLEQAGLDIVATDLPVSAGFEMGLGDVAVAYEACRRS